MNNKQIQQMSTDELITKSKYEDRLWPKFLKLFWLVFLGSLAIYPALLVITDFSKLPPVIADVFSVLWFVATLITLFIYTFYQRLSNLHHDELTKRK